MTLPRGLFTSARDTWRTPANLMVALHEEFGPLDDPCPGGTTDGLTREWGARCYINPPYGRKTTPEWIAKGIAEMDAGRTGLEVWLLPARTDTRWFHDLLFPRASEIRFLRNRLHFDERGRAPFPSMLVILRR